MGRILVVSVILYNKTAGEISAILDDLKQHHLVANRDFEFAYNPGYWDPMTGPSPKKTQFTFFSPALESWFALKYTNE